MADTRWADMFKNASYEKVDGDLGGLPTLLAQGYNPAPYQQRRAAQPAATPSADPRYQGTMAKIASALSGVVRGATFGLIDPITKAVYPAGGKILEESRAANPTESAVGEVAGTVGSAFLNPAGAASGALKAAIPGAKLLPTAARNALLTSTTAIPQAAGEVANGEGVGRAGANFLRNEAAGTVLGTAGEKLFDALPSIAAKIKKVATNTAVREGLGIDPKSFRAAATVGGKVRGAAGRARGEGLGADLIDLMNSQGIHTDAEKEAWLAAQKAKWSSVDDAFDQSGKKVSDFAQSINANPTVQSYLADYGPEGAKRLQDLIDAADKKAKLPDVREFLQKRIDFYRKNPKDLIDADTADVAKAIRDTVDGAFVPPELKEQYGMYRAIDDAQTREDFRNPKVFTPGSQTAGRMIGSGLAGGVLGGTSGFDVNDPEGIKKALTRSALGFAAGSIAPRAGAAIANKLTGRLAARIAPLIPELAARGEGVGGVAARLAGRLGGDATPSPQPLPASSAPGSTEQRVNVEEQKAEPENVAAAKEATNSAWADTVQQKLNSLYDSLIAPQYSDLLSREDFVKQISNLTENFDPKKTAGFVFTDKTERENYLRSYEAALRLQNVQKGYAGRGQDLIGQALGTGTRIVPDLGIGATQRIGIRSADERMAYDSLRDWAASLMTEQGKPVAKATLDQVSKDLDAIIALRVSPERKRQLLMDHLANYGLNVEQLMKYGQLGGITA